jgi:hypothetical protein
VQKKNDFLFSENFLSVGPYKKSVPVAPIGIRISNIDVSLKLYMKDQFKVFFEVMNEPLLQPWLKETSSSCTDDNGSYFLPLCGGLGSGLAYHIQWSYANLEEDDLPLN